MGKQPDGHISAAKSRLVHLGGLAGKTDAAERAILARATERREEVSAEIGKLAGRALADQRAGDDYTRLMEERGQLDIIIASAREHVE